MTTTHGCTLAYLLFEVRDLEAWDRFLTRFVGLTRGDTIDGLVAYRLDAHGARILLREGADDDVAALGFAFADDRALDAAVDGLAAGGTRAELLLAKEARARRVRRAHRLSDPAGNPIELVVGPATTTAPLDGTRVPGGFVTGALGMGHVALRAHDLDASERFYARVLGFRRSDRIVCTLAGGFEVDLTFVHANPRHHTLALGRDLPKRIHHFMLEMRELDDVGAALDRARAERVPLVLGLGRHPNDRMVSFYVLTPSGIELELGCGGRTIDDATWVPTTYDRISDWGHIPASRPRSSRESETKELRS